MNWNPPRFVDPNGVTVNSQGCKPLESWESQMFDPNGVTVLMSRNKVQIHCLLVCVSDDAKVSKS